MKSTDRIKNISIILLFIILIQQISILMPLSQVFATELTRETIRKKICWRRRN